MILVFAMAAALWGIGAQMRVPQSLRFGIEQQRISDWLKNIVQLASGAHHLVALQRLPDADTDGLADSLERANGSNPADPDSDNDGDIDGPWATGTGRYGVRYAAGAPVLDGLTLYDDE